MRFKGTVIVWSMLGALQGNIIVMVVAGLLAAIFVFLVVVNLSLHRALRRFRELVRNVNGKDIEGTIIMCLEALKELKERLAAIELHQDRMKNGMRNVLSHVGLVKFDAFPGVGGKQSFALALLNEEGCGVVMTSICGREEVRLYAKPVIGGKSPYPLSEEESESIRKALLPPTDKFAGDKEES